MLQVVAVTGSEYFDLVVGFGTTKYTCGISPGRSLHRVFDYYILLEEDHHGGR